MRSKNSKRFQNDFKQQTQRLTFNMYRSSKIILNFDTHLIKSVTFKKENEFMLLDLIIQTIYYEIHNTNYLLFSICR